MKGPLPLEAPDPYKRRLDCANVNRCLSVADAWGGFECPSDCSGYRAQSGEERYADLSPMADMWTAVHWRRMRPEPERDASTASSDRSGT